MTFGELVVDINKISFDDLPAGRAETFIYLEGQLREAYERARNIDSESYMDDNGNYSGDHEPERTYVSNTLAFLDELDLTVDVADIRDYSRQDNREFMSAFTNFKQKINYALARFKLKGALVGNDNIGTVMSIQPNYKLEIGSLLQTVRKIVNQEIETGRKKDIIFAKIISLQKEVDRDHTTIDSLFNIALDLTRTISECAENLEPLLDKVERLKKLIWDGSKGVQTIAVSDRPKLIEPKPEEYDGEIPF